MGAKNIPRKKTNWIQAHCFNLGAELRPLPVLLTFPCWKSLKNKKQSTVIYHHLELWILSDWGPTEAGCGQTESPQGKHCWPSTSVVLSPQSKGLEPSSTKAWFWSRTSGGHSKPLVRKRGALKERQKSKASQAKKKKKSQAKQIACSKWACNQTFRKTLICITTSVLFVHLGATMYQAVSIILAVMAHAV